MSTRNLWGEMEEEADNEMILQSVNFNPIIELGMQNIPEISITVKSSPIMLPEPNLITHTIQLHAYCRQLVSTLEQVEDALAKSTVNQELLTIPNFPPQPESTLELKHAPTPGVNHLPKVYNDFSTGIGPVILPFTPESHKRALKQCAAIALAFVGTSTCTNTALDAVADGLDSFLSKFCKSLRSAVDKQASCLPSGFADAISRVLTDLKVGNLHDFYQESIVDYHLKLKQKCKRLANKIEYLAGKEPPPLQEVPELHFPAVLDGSFTPSLETGYQMLQNLEQEQLEGLEFIEIVGQEPKLEPMDYVQPDAALSPNSKKKRII